MTGGSQRQWGIRAPKRLLQSSPEHAKDRMDTLAGVLG